MLKITIFIKFIMFFSRLIKLNNIKLRMSEKFPTLWWAEEHNRRLTLERTILTNIKNKIKKDKLLKNNNTFRKSEIDNYRLQYNNKERYMK